MKNDKNRGLRKILVIGLILIILGVILIMFQNNAFSRPFEDFNGSEYIPNGYNMTDNMSEDNQRIFEYAGNGTFYVGVIKNTTTNELHEFMEPFEEDPQNLINKSENIMVNGHEVTFQTSEYNLDLHGMDMTSMIPEDYNISTTKIHDVNINMVKFQATWYCNETKLTYIAEGLVTTDQIEEMKKVTQSIKCHQEKTIWDQLKIQFHKITHLMIIGNLSSLGMTLGTIFLFVKKEMH